MPAIYSKNVRNACGALRHEGVMPQEIQRRLHEGEGGLSYRVPLSLRTVYEYIAIYNEEFGPPPSPEDEDQSLDSMARLKKRAIALVMREITYYERRKPGRLRATESARLRSHFATLDDMERREEAALQRRSARPKTSSPRSNGNKDKGEEGSALERLAREQAKKETGNGENPSQTSTSPALPDQPSSQASQHPQPDASSVAAV